MSAFILYNGIPTLVNSKTSLEQIIWLIFIFIIFFSDLNNLGAQVPATGNVFAEIVEPTGITVNTNNNYFRVKKDSMVKAIELGEIALNNDPERIVEINILSTDLKGRSGRSYYFRTFLCTGCSTDPATSQNKDTVFKFAGMPDKHFNLEDDKYVEGKYQVVFSYN